jgi:hypothetical protein
LAGLERQELLPSGEPSEIQLMANVRDIAKSKGGNRMSKFIPRSEAAWWVLSISQAAGMLGLNILLRVAVS